MSKKLASLVSVSTDLFTPATFLGRDGSAQPIVNVMGYRHGISPRVILQLINNIEALEAAAVAAIEMSQRPGEAERLQAAAEAKAGKKATKSEPARKSALAAALGDDDE